MEIPDIKFMEVHEKGSATLVPVTGTYVIESNKPITHEEKVFYVKDPIITVYRGETVLKEYRFSGTWLGRVNSINGDHYLLLIRVDEI